MSLVRFQADGIPATDIAGLLADCGRQVDRVWTIADDVVVLLPEIGPSQAQAYVARVSRLLPALAGPPRAVTFPNDGLTLGALAAALYEGGDVSGELRPFARPGPEPVALRHLDPGTAPELARAAEHRKAG